MRPLKGAKSVVEASWSSSYGVCLERFGVSCACVCHAVMQRPSNFFRSIVRCTCLCLYTDFKGQYLNLITPIGPRCCDELPSQTNLIVRHLATSATSNTLRRVSEATSVLQHWRELLPCVHTWRCHLSLESWDTN